MVIRMSDEKKPDRPQRKGETGLALEERTRTKKPPMYKVLLHNDDYTTKEFVVFVLQSVFHRSEVDSIAIMEHVHTHGVGVAGVYTFEVADWQDTHGFGCDALRPEFPWITLIDELDAQAARIQGNRGKAQVDVDDSDLE